jgi:dihydrofolate reductase
MGELRVHNFSVSLDGFGAGPAQDRDHPLGVGGELLHEWLFSDDATEVDRRYADRRVDGVGATIMGWNMFGPAGRSAETEPGWRGWWGDDPPFHHDVFVLTHRPRPSLQMAGGTTFAFVTDGIEAALDRARAAAGARHVCLGGGVSTVRQYARAGLLDEIHVVVVPVLLGAGERLFGDPADAGWRCVEFAPSRSVTHVLLRRRDDGRPGL